MDLKKAVVDKLREVGPKVALRNPQDFQALYDGDRDGVTLHNDCMLASGPAGTDGGTFPEDDREAWVEYTKEVSSGNTYGGEPCSMDTAAFDWTDYSEVCGENGLEPYIHEFQISYLNVSSTIAIGPLNRWD